jgi:hypothetical protein
MERSEIPAMRGPSTRQKITPPSRIDCHRRVGHNPDYEKSDASDGANRRWQTCGCSDHFHDAGIPLRSIPAYGPDRFVDGNFLRETIINDELSNLYL